MLMQAIRKYLAVRRGVGFQCRDIGRVLTAFARYASKKGDTYVRSDTAMEWAVSAASAWQREQRLRKIAQFARHARAEDPRHEIPPVGIFAERYVRRLPHVYSPDEIRRLLRAGGRLRPRWPMRRAVFTTLVGLLVSTGLRISEALALRFGDVTPDGLVIRKTKFNKSRLVPLHPTTEAALRSYLRKRRRAGTTSDFVFISPRGGKLPYGTIHYLFRTAEHDAGLRSRHAPTGPRIHDLRHTFAVRSLESAPDGTNPVGRQVLALSTYLGHGDLVGTCWYLQATPCLMRGVSDSCERLLEGGER
jgi:integrase